jgi:hypothetical protein
MNENFTNLPSFEQIKDEVVKKIEQASGNPISEDRLGEIEDELKLLTDNFIETGNRSVEQLEAEKVLEEELFKSSAIVGNITEFRIMLDYLSEKFGSEHKWVENYLAHENAHASVAEATGHEFVGYATIFIKDNKNEIVGIQPLSFTKPQLEWGPEEMIKKGIETTEAPEKYSDKLSEGDETALILAKQRLEKIEQDKQRLSEIRKELGIK